MEEIALRLLLKHLHTYSIVNQELLEYISFRERNSYNFLCLYIEKVLKDSGIYRMFEYFFRLQDKNSFKELKDAYTSFTIQNTPINGATECGRIFTKVLNPLSCKYKKCGTERGHLSKDIITQDMIMYNLMRMAKQGAAVLIASQNMNELRSVCDSIYVVSEENHTAMKYII